MKAIKEIRTEVLTLAWKIFKNRHGYGNFAGCLKEAWKRIKKSLKPINDGFTKIQIRNMMLDISNGFQLHYKQLNIWSKIMERADEVGHFTSEIVERVIMTNMNRGISDKQAWAVAYFAEKNGLI